MFCNNYTILCFKATISAESNEISNKNTISINAGEAEHAFR